MNRQSVVLFTLPGCTRCQEIHEHLTRLGHNVTEVSSELDSLLTLKHDIRESVLSEIEWRDGAVPVIMMGGKVLSKEEELVTFPEIFAYAE